MRCIWTAGAARIAQKSRAFGIAASSSRQLVAVFVDVMSTTGGWPVTVTLCQRRTFNSVLTVAVNPGRPGSLADDPRPFELVGDLVFTWGIAGKR